MGDAGGAMLQGQRSVINFACVSRSSAFVLLSSEVQLFRKPPRLSGSRTDVAGSPRAERGC